MRFNCLTMDLAETMKLLLIEICLLGLCFLGNEVNAHILVYRAPNCDKILEEFNDLPAQFGPSLASNSIKVYAMPARQKSDNRDYACEQIENPEKTGYPKNAKYVAIIQRGGNCTFEKKVRVAQAALFDAVIVYNNYTDDLEQMSAENSTGILIPSVFVGHTSGIALKSFMTREIVLVIDNEMPFNINTQLLLPFAILIGICFLIMIFYMIYKCIREERRLRRYRLPKRLLKKLPILKYTKNNTDLSYDTCVICLDEFVEGDKLRVLPCKHTYHSHCIDPWLTENRRVCPICKRKVFTKGDARSNRNRQSSSDSVTDTDDDTTPLLQPSAIAAEVENAIAAATTAANSTGTTTTTTTAPAAGAGTITTRHGTFRRSANNTNGNLDSTSDDENVLLSNQTNSRRVNPFDRTPNLPPNLAEQLNGSRRSFWSLPIFRLFSRRQQISVAAPPYLDEVLSDATEDLHNSLLAATSALLSSATLPHNVVNGIEASSLSSNNILNPNLSGSFKDDNDIPHQSIYEPIAVPTPTNQRSTQVNTNDNIAVLDTDSVFIQTPSIGGIGVVALPNTNNNISRIAGSERATVSNTERQFLI